MPFKYQILYQVSELSKEEMVYDAALMYALFYEQDGSGWKLPSRDQWFNDTRLFVRTWYVEMSYWGDERFVQVVRFRPFIIQLLKLYNKIKRCKKYVEYLRF